MMSKRPKLYGVNDAARLLGISHQRFIRLVRAYDIPHQSTSSGKIFFEDDLIAFKDSPERKKNLKYRRKG